MKTLVIIGHANPNSLNHFLAQEFIKKSKGEIRVLDLAVMNFDPILRSSNPLDQELEPDLKSAQKDILWCDHIALFFPIWWSNCPAILKGFFDRALTPGFAFKYEKDQIFPSKLLNGKTAQFIVTSDSPTFYRKYILNDPAVRAIKRDTFGFCGIKVENVKYFGPVRNAGPNLIQEWATKLH